MAQRTIKDLQEILFSTLHKVYYGEGLFINIDIISINDIDEDSPDLSYFTVEGTYGRYNTEGRTDLNFTASFELVYGPEDSDDFISGMFYQILLTNEGEGSTLTTSTAMEGN